MVKVRRKRVNKNSKRKNSVSSSKKKKKSKNAVSRRFELNPKELRVNLDQLQKDVGRAYSSMMKIIPESIKEAEIKPFGNASHIILPKELAGKKATVIIRK